MFKTFEQSRLEVEEREATDGQEKGTILEVVNLGALKKAQISFAVTIGGVGFAKNHPSFIHPRKSGYKCDGKVVLPVEAWQDVAFWQTCNDHFEAEVVIVASDKAAQAEEDLVTDTLWDNKM